MHRAVEFTLDKGSGPPFTADQQQSGAAVPSLGVSFDAQRQSTTRTLRRLSASSQGQQQQEQVVSTADVTAALAESFTRRIPMERCRASLASSSDEVKRLVVFAPRLSSFKHRCVNSIRHPRLSQHVWQPGIATKGREETTAHSSVLSSIFKRNGDILCPHINPVEYEASKRKWSELAELHDELCHVTEHQVSAARSRIVNNVDFARCVRRIWDRITLYAASDSSPSDFRMTRMHYYYFELNVYAVLFDPIFSIDSLGAIEQDYLRDSGGGSGSGNDVGVRYADFAESMFEMVDNWTSSTHEHEYVALISDILVKVFSCDWASEFDAVFMSKLKKRMPNSAAVMLFSDWQQTRAKQQQLQVSKFISAIEAEDSAVVKSSKQEMTTGAMATAKGLTADTKEAKSNNNEKKVESPTSGMKSPLKPLTPRRLLSCKQQPRVVLYQSLPTKLISLTCRTTLAGALDEVQHHYLVKQQQPLNEQEQQPE